MPSLGLSELVLVVRDVQVAARFYRDAVGLQPEREPKDGWAWFWAGEPGRPQRLALSQGPLLYEEHSPRPPGTRFGPVHLAFEIPRPESAAAADRIRRFGAQVFGPRRIEWMRAESHYFYDPDANLVEFWSPDPPPSPGSH